MKKLQLASLAIIGILLLGVAVYYWVTTAGSLMSFMPGYTAGSSDIHVKHGLAALLLALGCGVLIWFMSGKRTSPSETPTQD